MVYKDTFTPPVKNQFPSVDFNSIALYNLNSEALLEAIINNNCDDVADNLFANGDTIEFQRSSGKVVKIFRHTSEPKESSSFNQSPWQKKSYALHEFFMN